MQPLLLTSPAFSEGGWIPLDHTARGKNLSPALRLSGLDKRAVSLAVTMDDASHPIFPNYNHWVLWNVPAREALPAAIPAGKTVLTLSGAVQGIAYGRNRYKGPKPPFKAVHSYTFTVYVLDCTVSLPPHCKRKDLLAEMEGHILQKATLTGKFQSGKRE